MKFSEMNGNQKKAFLAMKEAYNNIVGGLVNTLMDYDEDSEEFKDALESLKDKETLVEVIREQTYWELDSFFGREGRYAGEAFINERIERRLARDEEVQAIWNGTWER